MSRVRWQVLLLVLLQSAGVRQLEASDAALFPSAVRAKRGTHTVISPTFQHSVEDANLLFEILLSGAELQGEAGTLLVPDEELASLRSVEKLEVLCHHVLPKTLSDVLRLAAGLERRGGPLSRPDFEKTVLTLVYGVQTAARTADQHRRQMWADAVVQLFGALGKDLQRF